MARAGVRPRSLSLGKRRSTRACRARAPCRAGRDWHTPDASQVRRREASPLLCTRLWCDVPAASFNTQPAVVWHTQAATALAVSGEEAQHSKLMRARAVPRWLWSPYSLRNGAVLARGLSHSVADRGATCYLRPPKHSRLSRGMRRHCDRCLCGGGAARKRATFARRVALVAVVACPLRGKAAPE